MNDKDFLMWILSRLEYVHGDNPNADFMLRLKTLANKAGLLEDFTRLLVKEGK